MKKAYSVVSKINNVDGVIENNIFTSTNQERVVEEFNKEVNDIFDWNNPDFQNDVLTAKQTETTEGWKQGNFAIITDYKNQEMRQILITETPYKKRNVFFNIQRDDIPSSPDQRFDTLKAAKEFVDTEIVKEGKIDHGSIFKYQEFVVDDKLSLYNVLVEAPFIIKKGKVHYSKQIKHE